MINLASLFVVTILLTAPVQIAPQNGQTIIDRNPTLIWQGKTTTIQIDDNPEFTSPKIIDVDLDQTSYRITTALDFKTYYWKIENTVSKFTVSSFVAVEKNQTDLYNKGNTPVAITGFTILNQNESMPLPKINILAKQHDE